MAGKLYKTITLEVPEIIPRGVGIPLVSDTGQRDACWVESSEYLDLPFNHAHDRFVTDLMVLYLLTDFTLLADHIVVKAPVSTYVAENGQRFVRGCLSWLESLRGRDIFAKIHFQDVSDYRDFRYTPLPNQCVLGYSKGKESTAAKIIAEQAGYTVHTDVFSRNEDVEGATTLHLYQPNVLYRYVPAEIDQFAGRMFDYERYLHIVRLGLLMFKAEQTRSGVLLMGSEFGNSIPQGDGSGDMAADEGLFMKKFFEEFLHVISPAGIKVYSPVATLMDVAIEGFNNRMGLPFSKRESCLNYDYLDGKNCEACKKCISMKVIGQYLAARGIISQAEFFEAFKTPDYPLIYTPEGTTYSLAAGPIMRDMMRNSPLVDWSMAWIDAPQEIELTGPRFLAVVQTYFHRLGHQLLPAPAALTTYDLEYARAEIVRYLGEDYRTLLHLPRRTELELWLPYEYELCGSQPLRILSRFGSFEVYCGEQPAGKLRLTDGPVYITRSAIVKGWLQKKAIIDLLTYQEYPFTYEDYPNGAVS